MRDFAGKVAVVTGAASGIGLALAHRFAAAGMKVVLADVEQGPLDVAARAVAGAGVETLAVRTDVSKAADVDALATRARSAFGGVHVVCNNAGVAVSGMSWTHTLSDWQWVLGVNLWGVIHGIRAFVPIMLAQGGEGHIVNTASIAGLTCAPGISIYNVSKHGVVAVSETLHHELAMLGSPVKVSVLCPGFVNTRILDSARNRPAPLADTVAPLPGSAEREEAVRGLVASGIEPTQVAERVFEAIRDERFYVFPSDGWTERLRARMDDMVNARNPSAGGVPAFVNRGTPES
jgi:NAD(P)-dependent dehydrogenase (short-subunit alcohol dehydrogenase family)